MTKTAGIAVNTATDPGVVFGVGNGLLNLPAAGLGGLVFNLASIAICAVLRARAERGHSSLGGQPSSAFEKILNHRGTSLGFAGAAQFGVAAVAVATVGFAVGTAIPFIFGVGNTLAAIGIEGSYLQKIRQKMTRLLGQTAATILTTPEVWSSMGLMLTARALLPGIIFAVGGAVAVIQTIRKMNPDSMRFLSFANNKYIPFLTLAAGNFIAVGISLSSDPYIAVCTALFGTAYLSICAANKYGGIYQAARAIFKPART